MKKAGWSSFYSEALLLVVIFVALVLVLTGVFTAARAQSASARRLSRAVTIAANTAEAVSAAADSDELLALLNENGNAAAMTGIEGVTAYYAADGTPDPEGDFRVDVFTLTEPAAAGSLFNGRITVRCGDEEPVYVLETVYFREEAAS
jgi:Tfp pilus assembly protein PilV